MIVSSRALFALVLSICLLPTLSGCDSNEDETMLLRVVHAAPGAAAIEFLIDFNLFTSNLTFRNASPYTEWDAGLRRLEARTLQGTQSVTREELFDADRIHTLLVTRLDDPSGLVLLEDDRTPVSTGQARIRAVNATSSITNLNVLLTDTNGATVLDLNVGGYGNTSTFTSVDAGTYDLTARSLDGSTNLPTLSLPLENGRRYLLVATNTVLFSVVDG